MAIIINNRLIDSIYFNSRAIKSVYKGYKLVWTKDKNNEISQMLSCFSNGYWIDEYPWVDDLPWAD